MKLRNKKTGDVVYVDFQIPLSNNDKVLGAYSVTSLKELNECFEDYTPQEPLIKDEKIRKAVRAWADALDIEYIHVFHDEDIKCIFRSEFSDLEIQFDGSFEEQIKGRTYTITELCGEE